MANKAFSYDDKAVRENLLAILTNISPTDTQLVTGLGVVSADAQRVEWLKKTLQSVKTNAYAEGADVSFPTLTNPSRLINYTQISRQAYQVSGTEEAVDQAGFSSRMGLEANEAMLVIKNDMEYSIMRGSLACGASAVVGQCKGVKNWLDLSTAQSGISLTENMLNDYLQNVWDIGTTVNALYCDMYIKRKISSFTGGATKNFDQDDRKLVNVISIYEADAAPIVKLYPHRHVSAGDTNHDFVGINEDFFKVAYLRKPFIQKLAVVGDSKRAEIITEYTLVCKHGDAGFVTKTVL